MTIRILIKNLDTETKRLVQVKQSDSDYVHNIEAGTEKEFHVHANNSFQITEGGNPSAETAAPETSTEAPAPETPATPVDESESTETTESEKEVA